MCGTTLIPPDFESKTTIFPSISIDGRISFYDINGHLIFNIQLLNIFPKCSGPARGINEM